MWAVSPRSTTTRKNAESAPRRKGAPPREGRHWRIFYGQLDEATLDRLLQADEGPSEDHVYQALPDEAWSPPPAMS